VHYFATADARDARIDAEYAARMNRAKTADEWFKAWAGHLVTSLGSRLDRDPVLVTAGLLACYLVLFVAPFLLALPAALPVVLARRRPPAFLLLRPFNRGLPSGALTRWVRRHAGGAGPVYTLADRDIRVPWYVRVPVLLGQLALFSWRQRRVRSREDLVWPLRAVGRWRWRTLEWTLSRNGLFPVGCSDELWKPLVRRLLAAVDVVIVDLSRASDNLAWELSAVSLDGVLDRTIPVVMAGEEERARALLGRSEALAPLRERLLVYGRREGNAGTAFAALLASALGAGAAPGSAGGSPP
jgi:hypothetical protein